MFQNFDKSGRKPRDVQVLALKWLAENWNRARIKVIRGDPGTGKSGIGRAVIEPFGGHYITPSNALLDQVAETYPDLPAVKGYQNFDCKHHEPLDCVATRALHGRFCADCPAAKARKRAVKEPRALANPVSYRTLQMVSGFKPPKVLVVDEAHTLPGMALLFADEKLVCGDFGMPRLSTLPEIREWAAVRLVELQKLGAGYFQSKRFKDAEKVATQIRKLHKLATLLKDPQNFVWEFKNEDVRNRRERVFYMHPIDPPAELMGKLLKANHVVLMSATIFPSDVEKMLPGEKFVYLDLPSPIPKEQRPILWRPMESANAKTDPAQVARWIQEQLKLHPGNAIVHVSYAWAAKLRPFSFYTVANFDSKDKSKAIAKFKAEGGVFLAAGCAEGLDLPGDLCRVNLIPILQKANIGDVMVNKRLRREGGQRDYDIEIIRTTIQQTGRSTRGTDDHSTTVIGDPMFLGLMKRYEDVVPKSFREAIKWEK